MSKIGTLSYINYPFPGPSSCSYKSPSLFKWEREGDTRVFIDHSIRHLREKTKYNDFGWFSESPELQSSVKEYLINNKELLKEYYINIFTFDQEIIDLDPDFFLWNPPGSNLPWTPEEDYGIHNKNKICSIINSGKDYASGHKFRNKLANIYSNCVDVYGSKIGPRWKENWYKEKKDYLKDYMFSIVIENCQSPNYYTEKITDCFSLGVIPIYWGSEKVYSDFNPEGIIRYTENFTPDQLNKELYESKIDYVMDNLERVKKLQSADDLLYQSISRILSDRDFLFKP